MGRPLDKTRLAALCSLELQGIAISADVDDAGAFDAVGGIFAKMLAAARSKFPVLRTIVVAAKQKELQSPELVHDPEMQERFYDPISELEILAAEDLDDAIDLLSRRQQRWAGIDCQLPDRPQFFVPHPKLEELVLRFMHEQRGARYLVLIGGMGRGKTTFMAEMIRQQSERDGVRPAYHFVGHNGSPADACKCIYSRLLRKHRVSEFKEWENLGERLKLDKLLKFLAERRQPGSAPEVIFIDAADQLEDSSEAEKGIIHFLPGWLPRDPPDGFLFVITSRSGKWFAEHRNALVEDLDQAPREERREIGQYMRLRGKGLLSEGFVERVIAHAQAPVFFTVNKLFDQLESSSLNDRERQRLLSDPLPWTQAPEKLVAEELERLLQHATSAGKDPHAIVLVLGLFVAAQAPLSMEMLQRLGLDDAILHWTLENARSFFKRPASSGGKIIFDHDGYPRELERGAAESHSPRLTVFDLEQCHKRLADKCASWQELAGDALEYALRFRLRHLTQARQWRPLVRAFADAPFITAAAKATNFGTIHAAAETAIARAQEDKSVSRDWLDGMPEFEWFLRFRIGRLSGIEEMYGQELINEFPAESFPELSAAIVTGRGLLARKTAGKLTLGQHGHSGYVSEVAFSPDGRFVASGSDDGTVKVWAAASGKLVADAVGHKNWVRSVSFSPDGRLIASGSYDHTVKVWATASGKLVADAVGHKSPVRSVSFSPDGRLIASGSEDHTVKVWEADSGKLVADAVGHEGQVFSVCFSPNGRFIASGSGDKTVKVWDAASGKLVADASAHNGAVDSVSFSSDGRLIGSASGSHTVKVWDAASGGLVADAVAHQYTVSRVSSRVSFSPDSRLIASGGNDHIVKVWEADSGKLVADAVAHKDDVHSVSFSPDGQFIASGGKDHTVKVWEAASGRLVADAVGHKSAVGHVSFSRDGRLIVSVNQYLTFKVWEAATWDKTVKVWEADSGRLVANAVGHVSPVNSASFSPDGRLIASGGDDRTVKVWEAHSGKLVADAVGHRGSIHSVGFSPDGRLIASGGEDHAVKVWETASGMLVADAIGHEGYVTTVSFSPDGRLIASGGDDRTVKVWEAHSGKLVADAVGHRGSIHSVGFSPDGRLIASGGEDHAVKVWETDSGRLVADAVGHRNDVTSISFSPDSKKIVSIGDFTVRIWDLRGRSLNAIPFRATPMAAIIIHDPDPRLLVSFGEPGQLCIYRLETLRGM